MPSPELAEVCIGDQTDQSAPMLRTVGTLARAAIVLLLLAASSAQDLSLLQDKAALTAEVNDLCVKVRASARRLLSNVRSSSSFASSDVCAPRR